MLIKRGLSHNTPENADRSFSDPSYVSSYLCIERLIWYGKMIDLFVDEAGVDFRDKFIADVGCATGHALRYVHDNYPHGPLYGYDYSAAALEVAKETLPSGRFILHDLTVPLDRWFNIIIGLELFEHLHKPKVVLDNLRSAIRDNGLIFLVIPDGRKDRFAGHTYRWRLDEWMEFSGASLAGISNVKRSPTSVSVIWSILEKEP